jgi:TusA-related sulfurtransferase
LRKISLKESPDLQHYLKELKEGDVVEVTYTDAMAIEVVPAD